MKLTLGNTKYQKFESIVVIAIVIIGLAVYGFFKLWDSGVISPGEETKKYVADYIKASSLQKVNCSWTGYSRHLGTGNLQVFVACAPQDKIPVEINNESDLQKAIAQYVISPAMETLPMDDNLSIVEITQINENTVICSNIIKRKIVQQWADSYDNYCMP